MQTGRSYTVTPTQTRKLPVTLQLPIMYAAANRRLAYLYVYADNLEAFDSIRRTAETNGVSLPLMYTYFESDQNRFLGALVFDFTGAQIDPIQLAHRLDQLQGIALIHIGEASIGLAASTNHELEVVGTPVVVIAHPFIGATHRRLVETSGESAEKSLFQAGEEAGRQAGTAAVGLPKTLGMQINPQLLRDRFHDLQVFGWAKVISLKVDDNFVGEALLADDFEATAWEGKASKPSCHWIRGFIAGALSSLEGKRFEVIESECQAKGDENCRMVFRPAAA